MGDILYSNDIPYVNQVCMIHVYKRLDSVLRLQDFPLRVLHIAINQEYSQNDIFLLLD